nr:hypothetical protein [uncultured Desulfobacter sp.]
MQIDLSTEYLSEVTDTIKKWIEKHDVQSLGQFCGKLSQSKSENPAVFERVQFMKDFN